VAKHFNTVILSADSRQCFKELNIGVARPTPEELAEVPHYFIASHSIHDPINAAWYEAYALELLQKLLVNHDSVVVTGGTGLYIKALTDGLDPIPPIDNKIRQEILQTFEKKGVDWLRTQLQAADPLFAAKGEMLNPQRMMRALEVVRSTGQSILQYRSTQKKSRPFGILQIGLELPREQLYHRINQRVDDMMLSGLAQEVQQLLPYRQTNALQTVGYKELFEYFDGKISLDEAVNLIQQNTRRYAKRQMTWFKRQADMHWINLADVKNIIPTIEQLMSRLSHFKPQ